MNKTKCVECGKEFIKPYRASRVCSDVCREKRKHGNIKGICEICGREFRTKPFRRNRRFCSSKCWTQSKESKMIVSKSQIKRHKSNPMIREKCHLWKGGVTPLIRMIREGIKYNEWRKKVYKRDKYVCRICGNKGTLHAHHIKRFQVMFYELLVKYSHLSVEKNKEMLFEMALNYEPFWDIGNGITLCKKCHLQEKPTWRGDNGRFVRRK